MQGTVKWFNKDKGFGFIESAGEDYFVHFRQIKGDGYRSLKDGANVEFKPAKGLKGMEAHDVTPV